MSIAGDTSPRIPGFNSYSETVLSPRRSGIAWQTATVPGNATLPTASGTGGIAIGNSIVANGIAINGTSNNSGIAIAGTANNGSTGSNVSIGGTSSGSSTVGGIAILGTASGGGAICIGALAIAGPSATSVAIGQSAEARGQYSIAIGDTARVPIQTTPAAIAIGYNSTVNSGANNSIAIGVSSSVAASATNAIAIGSSSAASANSAIAIRGTVNTGATNSIAIGVSSSVAASATSAIAIGNIASANAINAIAIGNSANAGTATHGIAVGRSAIISQVMSTNNFSMSLGSNAVTFYSNSVAIGTRSVSEIPGFVNLGTSLGFTTTGSSQSGSQTGFVPMYMTTTDATPTNLGILTDETANNTPTIQLECYNSSTYIFEVDIVARSASNAGAAAYNLKFAFDRQSNAASSQISALSKTILYTRGTTTGWDVTATADTTNGRPNITVTGAASTTIRWVGNVKITKVSN